MLQGGGLCGPINVDFIIFCFCCYVVWVIERIVGLIGDSGNLSRPMALKLSLGTQDHSRTKRWPFHIAVKLSVCPTCTVRRFVVEQGLGATLRDMTCCPGDKVPW